MSLLTVAARRRSQPETVLPVTSEEAPDPGLLCDLPPYPPTGTLNAIHPSVVDMGATWNGYRWWMANTPYPGEPEENPCIYASNDMVNWEAPPGLVNPIDPTPTPYYNSDTELVWDPVAGELICFYREAGGGTAALKLRRSANGSTWGPEEPVDITLGSMLSPGIIRWATGDWRMMMVGNGLGMRIYQASDPLGPWTETQQVPGPAGHHVDMIRHGDSILAAFSDNSTGAIWLGGSPDAGVTWLNPFVATVNDPTYKCYRPTLSLSPKPGWVDIWAGGDIRATPGQTRTWYTRVPLSAFGV